MTDFGSAKQTFGTSMGTSSTESYAAPEVLDRGEVGVEIKVKSESSCTTKNSPLMSQS